MSKERMTWTPRFPSTFVIRYSTFDISLRPSAPSPLRLLLLQQFPPIHAFASEHNHRDLLRGRDVFEWVSVNQEQVRVIARFDQPDSVVDPEQAGRVPGGGLQRSFRR